MITSMVAGFNTISLRINESKESAIFVGGLGKDEIKGGQGTIGEHIKLLRNITICFNISASLWNVAG